ncbi:SCP2 sterol-binding domain-containing protein [Micromonospora sp. 4G57]|uniref:SCP2 sterol-binding domain-containing protein n=1 Tax=Micromonospora sicca TaxID=2202420 RepID=A0ABU5JNK6_9ACTN|nr:MULTISPECIES: SCP2 sterol-binding domain-containing protein [unclassified Micromonospora]MDZ5447093.1 SCP2 sterol-binding domain-containing protein [Micromonospora sp. 4G57]MDZ5494166.1 SCP2 sterol-binding domain-containing protein [Micromonospora sp. 4G53]
MADVTQDFFRSLADRGHDRRLTALHEGSVRFDISQDGQVDHWLVSIVKGDITVSEQATGGDAVVRADRAVFDRIASGEAYFLTTVLRGEATVEGSPRLFATVRRLFPPPPASQETRRRRGDHE